MLGKVFRLFISFVLIVLLFLYSPSLFFWWFYFRGENIANSFLYNTVFQGYLIDSLFGLNYSYASECGQPSCIIPQGLPFDPEYDSSLGYCVHAPLRNRSEPCAKPYVYSGVHNVCVSTPICTGLCAWDALQKRCIFVNPGSGRDEETPSTFLNENGTFCVKPIEEDKDLIKECLNATSLDGTSAHLCPMEITECFIDISKACSIEMVYNSLTKKCESNPTYECPSGSSYNSATEKCEALPVCTEEGCSCPSGLIYNSLTEICEASPSIICPSRAVYNSSTGKCEAPPRYICPYGEDKPCVIYNNRVMCSPYLCGQVQDDDPDNIIAGLEDDARNMRGECGGSIYIFTGKSMRCRTPGWQTGFHNCCDEANGRLYDSTGSLGTGLSQAMDIIRAMYIAVKAANFMRTMYGVTSVIKTTTDTGQTFYTFYRAGKIIGTHEAGSFMANAFENVKSKLGLTGTVSESGNTITYQISASQRAQFAGEMAAQYAIKYAGYAAAQIALFLLTSKIDDPLLSTAANVVGQLMLAHLFGIPITPVQMAFMVVAVIMSIISFFSKRCDEQDIVTSTNVLSGRCRYIGRRCVKKILGRCIQRIKVYCCFNSKLARIIHEQGRPQLVTFGPDGNWGNAKSPNCRGFTPEEFQAIDFGRIDFSEYIEDIQRNLRQNIEPQVKERFTETMNLMIPGTSPGAR